MPAALAQAPTLMSDSDARELVTATLGIVPLRAIPQPLSNSGKAIFRIELPDHRTLSLRTSVRPNTFAFTHHNLHILHTLDIPVPTVLSAGRTPAGGSYMLLSWLPGRDLLYELPSLTPAQMTPLAQTWVDIQRRVAQLPRATRFGWAPIDRNGALASWTEVFGTTSPATATATDHDPSPLAPLRARLRAARIPLEPYFATVQPRPFLDDLTLKNFLVDAGHFIGIIDVDFVCYGDPLLALAATLSHIVADVGPAGDFYAHELLRLWNPSPEESRALAFYAALWSVGLLSLPTPSPDPARTAALTAATDRWLTLADAPAPREPILPPPGALTHA